MGHPNTKAARISVNSKHRQKRDFFGREMRIADQYKPNDINLVRCNDSYKEKLRFRTEREALDFIRYNAERISRYNGYAPVRAYWCDACCCWHVTSKPLNPRYNDMR